MKNLTLMTDPNTQPMDLAKYPPEETQHEKQPGPWLGHRAGTRPRWAAAPGGALPKGTLAEDAAQDALGVAARAKPLATLLVPGQPRLGPWDSPPNTAGIPCFSTSFIFLPVSKISSCCHSRPSSCNR